MSGLSLPPVSFPQIFPSWGNAPDNALTRGVSAVREIFGLTMALYLLAVIFPGSDIPLCQKISAYAYVVFATFANYQSRTGKGQISHLGHIVGFTIFTLGNAAYSAVISHDLMRAIFWAVWLPGIYVERATLFGPRTRLRFLLVPLSLLVVVAICYFVSTTVVNAGPAATAADLFLIIPIAHVGSINFLYLVSVIGDQYARAVARSQSALLEQREAAEQRLNAELAATRLQLERVNRSLTMSALAASIAHEISQPLAAVVTNAGAAARWLGDDNFDIGEARKALAHVVEDGHRASEVITSFRTMLNEGAPQREALQLNSLVTEALDILGPDITRNNVTVLRPSSGEPPAIRGDHVQLRQVFLNLFANAIEALGEVIDRPRLLIVRCDQDDDGHAIISVEDSGGGIAAKEPARIFEPFFSTKSRSMGLSNGMGPSRGMGPSTGMGIGLFISRMITEAHGGTLSVESRPGRTKFYVAIPVYLKHGSAGRGASLHG